MFFVRGNPDRRDAKGPVVVRWDEWWGCVGRCGEGYDTYSGSNGMTWHHESKGNTSPSSESAISAMRLVCSV